MQFDEKVKGDIVVVFYALFVSLQHSTGMQPQENREHPNFE